MGIWAVLIIQTGAFPRWVDYWAILLLVTEGAGVPVWFNFISVAGFRLFIFGLVSWFMLTGLLMIRSGRPAPQPEQTRAVRSNNPFTDEVVC